MIPFTDLTAPPAEQIIYVGRQMFERKLTDLAGGNISIRQGGTIHLSPRYAGSRQHWQLGVDDIITGPIDTQELLSHARFSREGKMHLAVYRSFPDVAAIIHAHPFHVLPFCVAGRSIEPVLEATQKFGVIPMMPYAPAHSDELAQNVVKGLTGKEEAIRKQAAAVLLSKHGIVVAGKDLFAVFDALERIDCNAWCILSQGTLPAQPVPYF
jgi:L-fuculose-phosphate aldolase